MSKGTIHDFELFKRNLHLVPTNSFILADKGYQGIYAIYIPIACYRVRLKNVVN